MTKTSPTLQGLMKLTQKWTQSIIHFHIHSSVSDMLYCPVIDGVIAKDHGKASHENAEEKLESLVHNIQS